MKAEEKEKFLLEAGWKQYYRDPFWVDNNWTPAWSKLSTYFLNMAVIVQKRRDEAYGR